ncbi:MAG TPA: metallopeptidase TldD-related protein [Candidatus Limnocylindria bacterium]|nr:metallopeptidase TldD-related protein [Candidatus Limnocylindria bacterium]
MDQRITDALHAHPGIDDWTLRLERTRGVQIYLVGADIESVRQVTREAYEVEVFNDHPAPSAANGPEVARGGATIPLARVDLDRLPRILDDAVTMASLINNPPWSLAGPAAMPDVALADPRLVEGADATAAGLEAADRIRDLAERERASGVRLSGAELFLTYYESELTNSQGAEASSTSTRILMEVTLLARGTQDETEYFRQSESRQLADLDLEETVRVGAQLARDKLGAAAPRTRIGPVVISGEALNQMMAGQVTGAPGAYIFQAMARTAYENLSRFEIGASIYGDVEPSGDLVTLRANAQRPFGVSSYRWDSDGLPAQDLLVIEDGILRARPATLRYAQYLGIPATGRPGVAEMAVGTTSRADLLAGDGPVLEVLDFSAPNVEALSGDFGMEIRVGYENDPSGRRAISGGSVTGNLFEAMANARFSAESQGFAQVAGPSAIRFESLQVAGEG